MIDRETLARFSDNSAAQPKQESAGSGFDMDGYLSKHGFEVLRRKPWQSHPGGLIYELARCPFNADHKAGSAAFTFVEGVPGFTCKHSGCHGKTITDVLATYPAERPPEFQEAESASKAHEKKTQAQILCELAADAQLFHTPQCEAYAEVQVDDQKGIWALRSKDFKRWLVREFYKQCGKPPGAQALQDAIGVLEAKAQFDWPEAPVFVRVAERGDAIYIDLCNQSWEAVEITPRGWRVVADPPIRFRRSKGMQPLPRPERGGSLTLLRDLINIGDDENWILFVSCLIAACRPRGPYPILILLGEQGTAKSTTEKLFRLVIDPSVALVRTPPRDERNLLIAACNSLVLAYDNLSRIPQWLSDSLCRIATGGGFSTRELYTDSEEVFFDAARPVVLNGIDHLADRPDLAERAVILNLPLIDESSRREELELYADFESKRPQIFGALCDAVSTALARLPHIKLARKPRMADFAVWAMAAAPAYGFSPEAFLEAYCGNQTEAIQDTLEGDLVATAVSALLEHYAESEGTSRWEGSCIELLTALKPFVDDGAKRSRDWPETPRGLSGQLRRLVTFLRVFGIEISFPPKGTRGKRRLTIVRTRAHSTATTASTATTDANGSPDQSHAAEGPSGGPASEVAEQSPPAAQPPPPHTSANPLNGSGNGTVEAVVAVEAVVCRSVPNGHSRTTPTSHRADLCARCGRVDWQ